MNNAEIRSFIKVVNIMREATTRDPKYGENKKQKQIIQTKHELKLRHVCIEP